MFLMGNYLLLFGAILVGISFKNSSILLSLKMTIKITTFWLHSVLPNKISAFSGIFLLFSKNTSVRSHFSQKILKPFTFPSFFMILYFLRSPSLSFKGVTFSSFSLQWKECFVWR